jgi:hypothetical protein
MTHLPARAWAFIALVISLSVPLVGGAVWFGLSTFDGVDLVMLALLYIVSDSIGARGSRDSMTIALGSISALASLPLLGGYGTVILACSTILVVDSDPWVKRVFNTSQLVLAAAAAAGVYALFGGGSPCGGCGLERGRGDLHVLPGVPAGRVERPEGHRENCPRMVGHRSDRGPLPEPQPGRGLLREGAGGHGVSQLRIEPGRGRVGPRVDEPTDKVRPDIPPEIVRSHARPLATPGG